MKVDGRQRPDAIDDGVRIGAVADEIAEHQHVIVGARRGEHGVERLEIGVDVTDNEISHVSSRSIRGSAPRFQGPAATHRPQMRLTVGGLPPEKSCSICVRSAASGPPSVGGHTLNDALERRIEPRDCSVGEHRRAVVGIDERAAASGHHQLSLRQQLMKDGAFEAPELRLTVAREDVRDPSALARLDQMIDVFDTPADPTAKRPRDAGFARPHEADEIELIGIHARSDSSTEKNSG